MVAALGKRSRCLEVIEPGGLTSRVTSDGSLVVAIETGTLIGSYGDIGVFHKGWPTTTSTSSTAALRIWAVCGCSKILAYVFIATDGIRSWPDLSLDRNGNSVAL